MNNEDYEIPNWKIKNQVVCTLSWEDLYAQAIESGYKPTKKDMTFMMNYLDSTKFDCNSDFNSWIKYRVHQYFEEIKGTE